MTTTGGRISRRQFVKQAISSGLALGGAGALLSACASATPEEGSPAPTQVATEAAAPSLVLPTEDGAWIPPAVHTGDLPTGSGTVDIQERIYWLDVLMGVLAPIVQGR